MNTPSLRSSLPSRPALASLQFGLVTAVCAATLLVPASYAAEGPVPAVVALQARLFYSSTGQLSADVLLPGGPELVNVVAAANASTASLVTVVVSLAKGTAIPSNSSVRLSARERSAGGAGRTLVDRSVAVGALAQGGVLHLGFWLQGTGCRPVQLQATLSIAGRAVPVAAAATLPFACNE